MFSVCSPLRYQKHCGSLLAELCTDLNMPLPPALLSYGSPATSTGDETSNSTILELEMTSDGSRESGRGSGGGGASEACPPEPCQSANNVAARSSKTVVGGVGALGGGSGTNLPARRRIILPKRANNGKTAGKDDNGWRQNSSAGVSSSGPGPVTTDPIAVKGRRGTKRNLFSDFEQHRPAVDAAASSSSSSSPWRRRRNDSLGLLGLNSPNSPRRKRSRVDTEGEFYTFSDVKLKYFLKI